MNTRIIAGIGAVSLIALAAGYLWMDEAKPIEADPDPVELVDAHEGHDHVHEEAAELNCPDTADADRLLFSATPTPEILAVLGAHREQVNQEGGDSGATVEKSYSIDLIDLNRDGKEDFVALYNGPEWCGEGGCLIEAFIQQEGGTYRPVEWFYSAEGDVLVAQASHNGFRQVIQRSQQVEHADRLWQWEEDGFRDAGICYQAYAKGTYMRQLEGQEMYVRPEER